MLWLGDVEYRVAILISCMYLEGLRTLNVTLRAYPLFMPPSEQDAATRTKNMAAWLDSRSGTRMRFPFAAPWTYILGLSRKKHSTPNWKEKTA